MITQELLNKFVEMDIIRERTEIDAKYRAVGIGGTENVLTEGTFLVLEVRKSENGGYAFLGADVIDGRRRILRGMDLTRIDGMDIDRMADTYGLSMYGVAQKPSKRRGRRPRGADAEMA